MIPCPFHHDKSAFMAANPAKHLVMCICDCDYCVQCFGYLNGGTGWRSGNSLRVKAEKDGLGLTEPSKFLVTRSGKLVKNE